MTTPRRATTPRRSDAARFERPELGDLVAGLSVALVLVPQGLAYAKLAGMPPALGLIAGTLPPILAAFFVSSPYLQTGPTALTALLVAGALGPLASEGSAAYVQLGALLALVVGVVRIVAGIARLGIAAYFVSQPVLTGFTTGAALLIVLSQVPSLLGVSVEGDRIAGRALEAVRSTGDWELSALVIGLATLAIVVGIQRLGRPRIPGVLIAVGVTWLAAELVGAEAPRLGTLPGELPSVVDGLPWGDLGSLLVPGFVIALVGFAEPASIARTYAAQEKQSWDADREFVSQGVANVAASAVGAFPVGGSFGRSSLNHTAGATTRWSGFVTGVAMLAFLPFSGVLESAPRAALAAVVVAAAIKLIRFDRVRAFWQWSRPQALTTAFTFTATIALDPRIDLAIVVGVVLSVAVHLWRELHAYTLFFDDPDGVRRAEPHGVIWFASVGRITAEILDDVADHTTGGDELRIDLGGVGRIDLTAAAELAEMANDLREADIDVQFVNVPGHAARLVDRVLTEG